MSDPGGHPGDALEAARHALAVAARAVAVASERDGGLGDALDVLAAVEGRVVVTGLGKSGLIGAKLAATLASTGTPAFFVHAAEALHGDAGMLVPGDVLLAISNSGETAEVCTFARVAGERGVPVVAFTGCGGASTLAAHAVATVDVGVEREADPDDLAPTASTTVTAAVGDALAVGLSVARGFGPDDFHRHHPGGALGRRLEGRPPVGPVAPAVCVLGSHMMDLVVRAPHLPTRGETVLGTDFATYLGGKGFNQAVAAARQGAATAMIGRLGSDDFGDRFRASLSDEGIDHRHVAVDPDSGTGVGLPVVDASGDNSIVVAPRANGAVTEADVKAAAELIAGAEVLLVQLELPLDAVSAAVRIARDAGVTVVLNPAPATADLGVFAGLIDVVVPNEAETAAITGRHDAGATPEALAASVAEALGCDVVLTLGAAGCLVRSGHETTRVEGHPVDVVDTVGAGDAFCGVLGARLAVGDTLAEAARHANAAAALSVTGHGAAPSMPSAAEVAELLGG